MKMLVFILTHSMIRTFTDAQSQDPDNDARALLNTARLFDRFKTNNYVMYQKGFPAYQHPEFPNANVVCAVGITDYNSFVCTGTVNPTAVARHGPGSVSSVDQIISSVNLSSLWLGFGGNDMQNTMAYASRMRYADDLTHVALFAGDLRPGELTTFRTVEAMEPTALAISLATVGAMSIVQPTELLTGRSVPFTIGKCSVALHLHVTAAHICSSRLMPNKLRARLKVIKYFPYT